MHPVKYNSPISTVTEGIVLNNEYVSTETNHARGCSIAGLHLGGLGALAPPSPRE